MRLGIFGKLKVLPILILVLSLSGCLWYPTRYNVDGSLVGPACGTLGYTIIPYDSTPELISSIHQVMYELGQITQRPVTFKWYVSLGQDDATKTNDFVFRFDHTLPTSSGGPAFADWDWPSTATRPIHSHGGYINLWPFYDDVNRTPVVRHEVGHAFGLNHVNDASEVMDGNALYNTTDWGQGTMEGLYALSVNNC